MKKLLDWIIRNLGYYTSEEVAACVKSAEDAANSKNSDAFSNADSELQDKNRRLPVEPVAIPADYIRYFLSYSWSADHCAGGFGCIEIGRLKTIQNQEDIIGMTDLIEGTLKARGFKNPGAVILNWQPFEPPRQDNGGRETADVENGTTSTVVLRLAA